MRIDWEEMNTRTLKTICLDLQAKDKKYDTSFLSPLHHDNRCRLCKDKDDR